MTPDEVLGALIKHEFDEVHAAASPEFQARITRAEIARVWSEIEASIGPVQSTGAGVVLYDLSVHGATGEAHLQVAYRDGTIAGLVLLNGPPTGHFGH